MSRKRAILPEPKKTIAADVRSSANDDARPARKRLKSSVLEELWSIWRVDPRVPSLKSRRSWAISHGANPRLVDNWFLRRKACAKKMGQPVSDGSYDLPLGLQITPKREQFATPIEPELEAIPDLPSDDILLYPSDGYDLEASSDTVFNVEDLSIDLEGTENPAYKEVPPQLWHEHHQFQPESSSDIHAAKHHPRVATSSDNRSLFLCNQSEGEQSNFTYVLCPTESAQGEVQSDFGTMPDSNGTPWLRFDFSPDTLSELSAIPFLFRTPHTVLPERLARSQSMEYWTIVEDELGCLVNDGELDFSFLDDPALTSMELPD